MTTDSDDKGMNLDALTVWLVDHPSASEDTPDLVALAQTLARRLDSVWCSQCERTSGDASDAREYRMVLKELHSLIEGDDGQEDFAAAMRASVVDSPDT